MPELPEVDGLATQLRSWWIGRRIERVVVAYPRLIAAPSVRAFRTELTGRRIEAVTRRAKVLCVHLDGGSSWLIHLRMTGWIFDARDPGLPVDRHRLLTLQLDRGTAVYRDPRRFGRMTWTEDAAAELAHLGPEPLERSFRLDPFAAALDRRSISIKQALLDPRLVAGIGNIYASESCHRAGLDPGRPARALDRSEVVALRRAIKTTLRRAIRLHAKPGYSKVGEFLVYGREGEPCRTCRAPIARAVHGQRSTFFCPACQR